MRPIKFREWDNKQKKMISDFMILSDNGSVSTGEIDEFGDDVILMQFTGLHDKNLLKELYEGDIIDANGNLKGNIYESPQIYEEGTDCLIEGMGTEKWRSTESIAMGRGCTYTK